MALVTLIECDLSRCVLQSHERKTRKIIRAHLEFGLICWVYVFDGWSFQLKEAMMNLSMGGSIIIIISRGIINVCSVGAYLIGLIRSLHNNPEWPHKLIIWQALQAFHQQISHVHWLRINRIICKMVNVLEDLCCCSMLVITFVLASNIAMDVSHQV